MQREILCYCCSEDTPLEIQFSLLKVCRESTTKIFIMSTSPPAANQTVKSFLL